MKIIDFKKKKMIPLTNEQQESYEKAKICYICREKYKDKYIDNKKYCRVRDHCHYKDKSNDLAHSICNLKYSILKRATCGFSQKIKLWLSFYCKRVSKSFWRKI